MQVHVARLPLYAAGLVVIVAAAATGCSASSSSGAGGGASGQASVSPLGAVQLAAKTANSANSFTGTMIMRGTAKPGAKGAAEPMSMDATFAERVHPSPLARINISSISSPGMPMPGGITEVGTATTFYIKWPYINQLMHLTKPWLVFSISSATMSSAIDLSQTMDEASGNGPLAQSQMLAAATSVRQVGTGTIDGVPVTEYTGKLPLDKASSYLSGTAKSVVEQANANAGFSVATFTDWIDAKHMVRKSVITEVGTDITENLTVTMTSINQPVNITVPPASQTTSLLSLAGLG